MKKIYILFLLVCLNTNGVYALDQEKNYTQESYIINVFNTPLRNAAGLFQKKNYTVMSGVVGKVLEEKKADGLTWVHVAYNEHLDGWVHKKLTVPYIDTFTLESGEKYSVYYKTPENQIKFLAQDVGDVVTSEISGEKQEIVWIVTDLRTPFSNTHYAWQKDQIEYINNSNELVTQTETKIPQAYDFRSPTANKVYYPWNIPEEIISSYQTEDQTISEKVLMVTSDFRTPVQSKIYYPWIKEQFTYASGSTDTKEPQIIYNMYDFRKPFEQKIAYPWIKEQFTYASGSTDTSITEKIITMIDSAFGEKEPIHYSIPWNKPEEIELSSASETPQEQASSTSITSKFGPEKPKGWTLSDFIDF